MSDQDLDPTLVQNVAMSQEEKDYAAKYVMDEVTFMLFDLERGKFINHHGDEIQIDDVFKFSYKRVTVEETLDSNAQTIVSNFFVTVWYNDTVVLKYEVYGGEKKFKVFTLEGFHASMFMNELDKFRMKKFGIEPK